MQNIPKPEAVPYFEVGDRVELTDPHALKPGRRGVVTYNRKLRRVGVKWDDDGTTAQIRRRMLRKLTDLELLVEGWEADVWPV
jgi:hypothetical protein